MKFALKLTVAMSGILILFAAIVSYVVYQSNIETLESQIKGRQMDAAQHIMDKIDRMLFERLADIKAIASDPVVSSRDSTPRQIRQRLSEFRNYHKTYISLSLFDLNRVRIADTSGLSIGVKHSLEGFWGNILEHKEFVMDVSESESLGQTVIHFGFPVKDKSGEVFGVVISRMPVSKLHYIVKKHGHLKAKSEEIEIDLIDKDGLLLYSTYNRKGILKDNLLDREAVKRSLAGEKKGNLISLHDGIEDIYVFVHEQGYLDFKGNDWSLLVHIPTKIAFAPAVKLRNTMLFIMVGLLVPSILIVLFYSRILTRPILELIRGTDMIGKGDLKYKVKTTTKDEVGLLAGAFNKMTESLQKTTVSKNYLENIYNCMVDSLIVTDSNGDIKTVNQATLCLLGYADTEGDELLGKAISIIIKEEEEGKEFLFKGTGLDQLIKKGFISNVEKTYVAKDGRKIPVFFAGSVMRDHDGKFQGIVCVATDITERKKAEREKAHLSMAIEQTAEAIVVTDVEGTIQYTNPAFEQITGYSSEEAIGKNPRILKSDKQDDAFHRKMWETISQGHVWHGHFINKKKDGTLYEVDAIISPVFDSSGKIFDYVGVSRDVTSKVRSQETIAKHMNELKNYSDVLLSIMEDMEEANKELKSANIGLKQKQAQLVQASKLASIGELAAGVAHELNQPLMVIRGFTQMMLKQADRYDEKTLKHLDTFELSTSKMMTIINHLRTFSRKQEKSPVKLDLHTPINNAFAFVNEQLKNNNIIVEKKYQPDLPFIKGDGNQLEQVIMNLISNATFAIDEFEKKHSAGNEKEDENWKKMISIKTGHERKKNQVWIEFADTGGGIPEDYLDKVFDPFFTSKEVGKGTGLGLSICYGIIKEHNGEIEVFNNKAGAVFKISLPCTTES